MTINLVKYLIINADDFGMSKVFNESILSLISAGAIKSTTVMINKITVDQKDQVEQLITLSQKMNLSIGIHLDFEGPDYEEQINAQHTTFLETFHFPPSHLDIHKPPSFEGSISAVAHYCKKQKLPCRNSGNHINGLKTTDAQYFHGTGKNFGAIEEWIRTLEEDKYYEILFHPGVFDPQCKSSLNKDREQDIELIRKLNSILEKYTVQQVSYLDLATL